MYSKPSIWSVTPGINCHKIPLKIVSLFSGLKVLTVNFPLVLKDIEETTNFDLIKTYSQIQKILLIFFDQYGDINCKEITNVPLSDKEIVQMCQEGGEV